MARAKAVEVTDRGGYIMANSIIKPKRTKPATKKKPVPATTGEYPILNRELTNDEARLRTLYMMDSPPSKRLDIILEAILNGANANTAALKAGLTPEELRKILEWGRKGHSAYTVFYEYYLTALGDARGAVDESVYTKAKDGDLMFIERYYKKIAPEEEKAVESNELGGKGITVNIITKFDKLEGGNSGEKALEAEYERV